MAESCWAVLQQTRDAPAPGVDGLAPTSRL